MIRSALRFLLLCCLATPAVAEVSVIPHGNYADTILMHITDDSDPIGHHAWQVFGTVDATHLNPGGFARGDGAPDVAFRPGSGYPVAVWAYNNGTDRDIVLSEWDGHAWTPFEFLTTGPDDDRDPGVFIQEDGTLHVVWWTAGMFNDIYLISRPQASVEWALPTEVTNFLESGDRPSVAVNHSDLFVGYSSFDYLVASEATNGYFTPQVVASLPGAWGSGWFCNGGWGDDEAEEEDSNSQPDCDFDGPSHLRIHAEQRTLWIDWRSGEGSYGYSIFDGQTWSDPQHITWTNFSWVGVEDARLVVRRMVLAE